MVFKQFTLEPLLRRHHVASSVADAVLRFLPRRRGRDLGEGEVGDQAGQRMEGAGGLCGRPDKPRGARALGGLNAPFC